MPSFFAEFSLNETQSSSVEDLIAEMEALRDQAQTAETNAETAQSAAEDAQAAAEAALASIPGGATSPWKLTVRIATTANIDLSRS